MHDVSFGQSAKNTLPHPRNTGLRLKKYCSMNSDIICFESGKHWSLQQLCIVCKKKPQQKTVPPSENHQNTLLRCLFKSCCLFHGGTSSICAMLKVHDKSFGDDVLNSGFCFSSVQVEISKVSRETSSDKPQRTRVNLLS